MTDTPDAPATIEGLMQLFHIAAAATGGACTEKYLAAFAAVEAYVLRLAAPVRPQKHEANSIHLGLPSGHDESAQPSKPAWKLHPFQALCEGQYAHNYIEERIEEILGIELLGVSFDEYDASLELYPVEEVADVAPTQEQHEAILALGALRYWTNFPDSTQRYGTGQRVKVDYPRWDRFNSDNEVRRSQLAASAPSGLHESAQAVEPTPALEALRGMVDDGHVLISSWVVDGEVMSYRVTTRDRSGWRNSADARTLEAAISAVTTIDLAPPPGSVDTAAAPATPDEQTCPDCNGSGDREFFDTTRGPAGEKYIVNCDRCGGTGAIPLAAAAPEGKQ